MSVNQRQPDGTLRKIAGLGTYNQPIPQYTTMPPATASDLDKVIQYMGRESGYLTGGFYLCVLDGSSYEWVLISQQTLYSDAEPSGSVEGTVWISDTDIPDVSA